MEETLEILKAEKEKILAKLKENNDKECYGENSTFKTAEEYQTVIGLLVNITASITQFEQTIEMKRRNAEQITKMQEEAKKSEEKGA